MEFCRCYPFHSTCVLLRELGKGPMEKGQQWYLASGLLHSSRPVIHPRDALALMAWSQGHARKFSDSTAANYFIESKKYMRR
jgi:hypothetical protein